MSALLIPLAIAAVLVPLSFLFAFLAGYCRFRGHRSVICPESMSPETITIDAARAAWTKIVSEPEFHVETCSRSPELACGKSCVVQVRGSRRVDGIDTNQDLPQISRLTG